jgi:GTPase SAR1 family protein
VEPIARIILLGDSSTGKTSLIRKFTENEFFYDTPMTLGKLLLIHCLGVDFKPKMINVNGKEMKVQIWDTAG